MELFGTHGVSGTSLQMIADAIGVTKAAVYHQFKTKDEIVIAVAEVDLLKVQAALDVAEAEESGPREREVLVGLVIDLAVERRHLVSFLQHDPVIVRFLAKHEPFLRADGAPVLGADRRRHRPRRARSAARCSRPRSAAR